MSKVGLGTIENGLATSGFPPEGPKKGSCVEKNTFQKSGKIRHLDHQIRIEGVRFPPGGSEKRELSRIFGSKKKWLNFTIFRLIAHLSQDFNEMQYNFDEITTPKKQLRSYFDEIATKL